MSQILEIAKIWDRKKIEDLRLASVMEDEGVAFDAIRFDAGGRRICLAVCATGHDQIRLLREMWGLEDKEASLDWHSLSAGDLVERAVLSGDGWAFAALEGKGEWLALYLVGVVPDSITMLEDGFGMDAT